MKTKGLNPIELFAPENDEYLDSIRQIFQLKRLYRQGWLKRDVEETACESVADHSFGTAILALLAPLPAGVQLDRSKAVLLALLHELGEVWAGDITPVDGVSEEEKHTLETESVQRVLHKHPEAAQLRALWQEFEDMTSEEARWVRQLDRLEMGIQARIYEAEGRPRMEEFLASADKAVRDPELRKLL